MTTTIDAPITANLSTESAHSEPDSVGLIFDLNEQVWRAKQIGLIEDFYSPNCEISTAHHLMTSSEEFIEYVISSLGSFPDLTSHTENVIWQLDGESCHTSQRVTMTMTNLGASRYGPATDRKVQYSAIIHRTIKNGKIVKEYQTCDNFKLASQLGVDIDAWVASQCEVIMHDKASTQFFADEFKRVTETVSRDRMPSHVNHSTERVVNTLHNIWNCRLVGSTNDIYWGNARLSAPARKTLEGVANIQRYYLEFQATMPDLKVSIDQVCTDSLNPETDHISIRWTMAGTHRGRVLWGEPTGAQVVIKGETHFTLDGDGKIIKEFTVYDELAARLQVARARLSEES